MISNRRSFIVAVFDPLNVPAGRAACNPRPSRRAGLLGCVALALLAAEPPQSLAAQAPGAVEVVVHDIHGAPVRGAAVRLETAEGREIAVRLVDTGGWTTFSGLPPGRYRLVARRLGLETASEEIVVPGGETARVSIRMRPAAVRVEGVEVRGEGAAGRERRRFLEEAGLTARVVGGEDLQVIPALGEADVLRTVELMPGVVSTSDFVAAYNVRGGSSDQNLVLLDGFPLFNPFHLGGLFSVFNPDVVARAELFTGGFGAEHGGRVSSVLNVETRSPLGDDAGGDAGVSLLASRLAWRTPLAGGLGRAFGGTEGGALFSARRSYLDWVLRPLVSFPYHLSDLQGRVEWETAGDGLLSAVFYTGRDVFDLRDPESLGITGDAQAFLRFRWEWGNRLAGVRWTRPVGDFELDLRAGWSGFDNRLEFPEFDDVELSSRIGQGGARAALRGPLAERMEVAVGVEADRIDYRNLVAAGGTEFSRQEDRGTSAGAFGQLRWSPAPVWRLEAGLRADGWWGREVEGTLSPRLAARRYFGDPGDPRLAVRASLGRYTQFLHSLRDEEVPIAIDTWVLPGGRVPALRSDQAQVGTEWYFGPGWVLSGDAFVRRFDGITELNVAADPNDPADEFLVGTGLARGADAFLRRISGRVRGWAALSLVRVEHTYPDPLRPGAGESRPTVSFPPLHDRRVSLDLVALGRIGERTELSARWGFGTGLPYTRPAAQHDSWAFDFGSGRYVPPEERLGDSRRYVVLGERNRERYPPYHRLDIGVRREFRPAWGEVTAFAQVVNVYDRRENVLFYFFDYADEPPTRAGLSMLPFLPTFGVEVSW